MTGPITVPAGRAQAGLYLPQIRMDFATIERRVRAAEEAGFHSAWFMDHLAPPAGRGLDMLDAWTVATAVLTRTERLFHDFGTPETIRLFAEEVLPALD